MVVFSSSSTVSGISTCSPPTRSRSFCCHHWGELFIELSLLSLDWGDGPTTLHLPTVGHPTLYSLPGIIHIVLFCLFLPNHPKWGRLQLLRWRLHLFVWPFHIVNWLNYSLCYPYREVVMAETLQTDAPLIGTPHWIPTRPSNPHWYLRLSHLSVLHLHCNCYSLLAHIQQRQHSWSILRHDVLSGL